MSNLAANSIYLGDIDPNNEKILDPVAIRRHVMYNLLIWDSIVLSDSQYLTDPRIHRLMKNYEGPKNRTPGRTMKKVDNRQKGFEGLVRAGLIEVAHRESGSEPLTMEKVWQGMERTGNVPFLPKTMHYASYLDTLGARHRDYELSSIADRFRRNLLHGLDCGDIALSAADETDQHLLQMFHDDPVYFRHIYKFLEDQRDLKVITQERYQELYNYVFSCYYINISAETNCYITSKWTDIPLHLNSYAGNFDESPAGMDQDKLYPPWGLNPWALDAISIDEFIDIRKEARKTIQSDDLVNFCIGVTKREDWKEFCEKWELYMRTLEKCWRECLGKNYLELSGYLADTGKVTQSKSRLSGAALVTTVFPMIPFLPMELKPAAVAASLVSGGIAFYSLAVDERRKREEEPLRERRRQLGQCLSTNANHAGIITRYGKPTN